MQTITLDVSRKHCIPPIYAKQSEVGRKFLAVITDNGVPYNIPENALLSVWYEGETDAGNYSSIEDRSAFSIDGNKVTVELVAQMLLKPGSGELCLSVTHGDGGETNTWNIPYIVEYKPGAGSSVPTAYYTAFQETASLTAAYAAEAKKAAQSMQILVPVGYTFHWSPVDGDNTDLSTPEKVAQHFGFGVWEQVKDRFLLGCGDTYKTGEMGGESTHTLTVDEMPTHRHQVVNNLDGHQLNFNDSGMLGDGGHGISLYENWDNMRTSYVGGNKSHNNMPPYLAVYTWKRIA